MILNNSYNAAKTGLFTRKTSHRLPITAEYRTIDKAPFITNIIKTNYLPKSFLKKLFLFLYSFKWFSSRDFSILFLFVENSGLSYL